MIWVLLAVIYDGLILLVVYFFEDYPLEKVMIGLSITNPIDLARIIFLIKFNISALMGYTGAVFQNFFGSMLGIFISIFFLLIWIVVPIFLSTKSFRKRISTKKQFIPIAVFKKYGSTVNSVKIS